MNLEGQRAGIVYNLAWLCPDNDVTRPQWSVPGNNGRQSGTECRYVDRSMQPQGDRVEVFKVIAVQLVQKPKLALGKR